MNLYSLLFHKKIIEHNAQLDNRNKIINDLESANKSLREEKEQIIKMFKDTIGDDIIKVLLDLSKRKNELSQELKCSVDRQNQIERTFYKTNSLPSFNTIHLLDGMSIQRILRDVDSKDLVVALKGSNQEICEVIFQNMSQRMGETVRSDMEYLHNVRKSDFVEAQYNITKVMRNLYLKGEIVVYDD